MEIAICVPCCIAGAGAAGEGEAAAGEVGDDGDCESSADGGGWRAEDEVAIGHVSGSFVRLLVSFLHAAGD
jgi:hypothetical protein